MCLSSCDTSKSQGSSSKQTRCSTSTSTFYPSLSGSRSSYLTSDGRVPRRYCAPSPSPLWIAVLIRRVYSTRTRRYSRRKYANRKKNVVGKKKNVCLLHRRSKNEGKRRN